MSKTVFLGVEGSGKTTLTMALAKAFESHKNEGWYLKPLSRDSFRFLKTLPDTLDGNFPSQTADLRELRWQVEYKCNDLGEIAILDYPGEIYRLAFLDEKDERDPEAFRQKVASNKPEIDALLGAIKEAEDVFVLFNLADGMDLRNNPRNLDAVWVTNECLKLLKRLESKPRIRLLFTQVDRYRDAGLGLSTFSPKSIDLIGHDHSDVPWSLISALTPPEDQYGINQLMELIQEREEANTVNNCSGRFIEDGKPLLHVSLKNLEVEYLSTFEKWWSSVLCCFIITIPLMWYDNRQRLRNTSKAIELFYQGRWSEAWALRYKAFDADKTILYYHGVVYLLGLCGEDVDYNEARVLFRKSAAKGNGTSLIALGWMAENGLGQPKNIKRAKELYEEANIILRTK